MGRNKTRKKTQRSGQSSEDPDMSETDQSSSDNVSTSLNGTIVLGNNVMDTDVEDSEQTTGNSTPADESDPRSSALDENIAAPDRTSVGSEDVNRGHLDQWLDDQQQRSSPQRQLTTTSSSCPHIKGSVSTPGLRKALKGDITVTCSSRTCAARREEESGAGDGSTMSSKELWICLQCGNLGCGDLNAQGGDAESHFKAPRSDHHDMVAIFNSELDQTWCYVCKTFVDLTSTKNGNLKDAVQLIKRHPKVRQAFLEKCKTGSAPIIALGPPPPPPQPAEVKPVEFSQFKGVLNKNKMNNRNRTNPYSSNWENSNKDDWPLGLENLGNTCFMNSALQCLSRTRSLIPKLDLYGTGKTIEIQVTAEPPSVELLGTVTPDSNGDTAALFQLGSVSSGSLMEENGDSSHIVSSVETETGGSTSPSSSEMDSLLDVASAASSKSSPSKELSPENYKAEIEKELQKCLRLNLVISKDSMTSRLRHAFKTMSRSPDVQSTTGSYGGTEYFGRGRHSFTPSAIHNAMAKNFRPGQQHDSHELLRTVIDMMKKDQIKAFRLAIMQCYGIKRTEGKNCDPKIAELLKQWDRRLYHKTFVDETFGGELVTFQTCLTCGAVRRSHEDFLDLSLPIRLYTKYQTIPKRPYSIFDEDGDSRRSVEDCLKSFIEPEQLTGSNAVECEKCHRMNLEKLAAGVSFEEVFPGVQPPAVTESKKKPVESEPEPILPLETEMDALEPLLMEEETPQAYGSATEDMDDLDEPAVDGILGNTSDMEDEGNDVPPIFLGEPEDKGISTSEYINSTEIPIKENLSLSLAVTQDEGFSESDSSEEKKSASISASSSRNSISEAENGIASSQKHKENGKPIPITKCPCSRRQMVLRPPECLTIHLKRFQITSHGTSKLSDHLNFPYILNLTPFCARDDEDLERLGQVGKDVYDEDGEVKYALYGIVEHSGSLHWGHYVAYIKVHGTNSTSNGVVSESSNNSSNNPEGTLDKWYYISDGSVSPSSLESVLGMDPYILFYERIRGQEKKDKLSQLDRLNNPSSSSSTNNTEALEATATTSSSNSYSNDSAAPETSSLN